MKNLIARIQINEHQGSQGHEREGWVIGGCGRGLSECQGNAFNLIISIWSASICECKNDCSNENRWYWLTFREKICVVKVFFLSQQACENGVTNF